MPGGDPAAEQSTHGNVVLAAEGIPRDDDRRFALGVLNTALGGGTSSRLFQEVREHRGLGARVHVDAQLDVDLAGVDPERNRGENDHLRALFPCKLGRALGDRRNVALPSLLMSRPITNGRCEGKSGPPILHQVWASLVFLHWPFDPSVIQRRLPRAFTVDTFDGVAFALPIDLAKNVAKNLIEGKKIEHARIGITVARAVADDNVTQIGAEVRAETSPARLRALVESIPGPRSRLHAPAAEVARAAAASLARARSDRGF